ncbi:hypothetical protein ABPG72_009682 [Tetrahymena utriculariae]
MIQHTYFYLTKFFLITIVKDVEGKNLWLDLVIKFLCSKEIAPLYLQNKQYQNKLKEQTQNDQKSLATKVIKYSQSKTKQEETNSINQQINQLGNYLIKYFQDFDCKIHSKFIEIWALENTQKLFKDIFIDKSLDLIQNLCIKQSLQVLGGNSEFNKIYQDNIPCLNDSFLIIKHAFI